MFILLTLIFWILAAPLLLALAYLFLLTLLSGTPPAPRAPQSRKKFIVLVPAHNEAVGIARTVANLLTLDWPAELKRITVIADNCSDDTAALARAAGAEVLERNDTSLRGKGYALSFAYERVIQEGWADAVVVVDADTETTRNLLAAFAARLEAGAESIQAFYGVLNPLASWRTRLSTIALSLFHRVRSRGRERMGVSAGLRGNGMCFSVPLLQKVPHRAFSIVEDLEYAVQLGLHGIRVHYADEAEALGEMVSTADASASQRQRWEGGRGQMLRQYGFPLLKQGLAQRSRLLLDLSMDVLVPPLAQLGLGLIVLSVIAFALLLAQLAGNSILLAVLLCWFFAFAYILRGVALSGLGAEGWLTLARAPGYLIWKLSLKLKKRAQPGEWVRTQREGASTPATPDQDRKS